MEGRIKRLQREWDHPANPGPDPGMVAEYARLWIEADMEEPQATALALEFLEYCQATGQDRSFVTLVKLERGKGYVDEDGNGGGEYDDRRKR